MHDLSVGLKTFIPHHFELAKLQHPRGVEDKYSFPKG
jgi:hypothetical protein